ncbi:type II secretion system protein GspL [Acinetobacter sp. WZC-1]|uniref:type II secretion system protein GspL n=1 Tax=Acinetobacter sp. WZC-1 TaxID=3459034 RepID=UPI00403E0CD6
MLYLWMPEAGGSWQWSRGENWTQAQSLEQLIHEIKSEQNEDAVVYFPSRDVQILQQNLSKAQYKQLGPEGIKYLLEEFVISSVDQMKVFSHFEQPDRVSVLGVAQNMVLTLQHALSLIPVRVISLLPDFLMLPVPEENYTVLASIHGRLLVRESEYLGNSIDDLSLYLDVAEKDRNYQYSGLTEAQTDSLFAVTTPETRESFDYQFTEIKKTRNHVYNILPHEKKSGHAVSGYWKACAAVLVALLLVQFSYDALRWFKLKKIADQSAVIAMDQYHSWFGDKARVTEETIRDEFKKKLDLSIGANTQALQLLSRVGPILMQHQIIANKVDYDASILNMDLVARSSDALQTLVKQLNQQGFKAELGNIQTQDSSVVGLVKIQ